MSHTCAEVCCHADVKGHEPRKRMTESHLRFETKKNRKCMLPVLFCLRMPVRAIPLRGNASLPGKPNSGSFLFCPILFRDTRPGICQSRSTGLFLCFSIFRRRQAKAGREAAGEIIGVFIAAEAGDLGDAEVGLGQQFLCFFHAQIFCIGDGCGARDAAKG